MLWGSASGEFVNAYEANRRGSMALSAETSAVARAIVSFLKKHSQFIGTNTELLDCLSPWKWGVKGWPKDAARLSSELRRLRRPLAAIGIECSLDIDLRPDGHETHRGIKIRPVTQEKP